MISVRDTEKRVTTRQNDLEIILALGDNTLWHDEETHVIQKTANDWFADKNSEIEGYLDRELNELYGIWNKHRLERNMNGAVSLFIKYLKKTISTGRIYNMHRKKITHWSIARYLSIYRFFYSLAVIELFKTFSLSNRLCAFLISPAFKNIVLTLNWINVI